MKEFKIFIASSNDEKDERNIIRDFLLTVSKETHDFGIEFIPVMWEMESVNFSPGLSPKQNAYNKKLISSDMAFFFFGKRVGEYTIEEFKIACEQVESQSDLKVFVYFKGVEMGSTSSMKQEDAENLGNVLKLKKFIYEKLKQVPGEFENASELLKNVTRDILNAVLPVMRKKPQSNNIERLVTLYQETSIPSLRIKREKIINDAINSLFFLRYGLSPDELSNKNFYDLLHTIISNTPEGAEINALSVMLKSEWDDSEDEKQFWADNRDAVKRKVNLERIFVVNKNEAHRLKTIPQIINHITLEGSYSNIHSYVVEKETLRREKPQLLERAGNGFIMINNSPGERVALLDEKPESDKRAKTVLDTQGIDEIISTFKEIKKYAQPLKQYMDNISWSHYKKEMISIFMKTKCNLNCDYCFTNKNQNEHKGQTISFDFVKRGIDDYFSQNYMRHVRFFGAGEPTVEFDLLQRIHNYALEKGGSAVSFEIQTNGAFSDRVANWLKNNIDIIWISCDGTPEIQDMHRPFLDPNIKKKSSEVIEKNIRILRGEDSKSFVGMRATITEENIHKQIEMIDYFYSLGIHNIWVDPIFPSVGESASTDKNEFDTMAFAEEFLKAAEYAHSKRVFYGSILTCNFNDAVNKHCRACLPVPHLTTDGYVSACDMALFGKDNNHMSPLIYGKWDENTDTIYYDDKKIERIRMRTTENMQHCEMCPAKEHCGGYCLGEVLNETGDLFGRKSGVCQAICYLDKKLSPQLRKYKYTHP